MGRDISHTRRDLKKFIRVAALTASFFAIPLQAQQANDFTLQNVPAPDIRDPSAASIAGRLESWFGSDPSARGSLSYTLPLDVNQDRAPLLHPFTPQWSPGQGLSQWGLGWNAGLTITRTNALHEISLQSDDQLQSPWGLLTLAKDGAYYPQGLQQRARARVSADEITVQTHDGRTFSFRALTDGARNLEWQLTQVVDQRGYFSNYTYEEKGADQRFLSSIQWGLREDSAAYSIRLTYESLPSDRIWVGYRWGGSTKTLDRRVSRVQFNQVDGGKEQERWHFELAYWDDAYSPAFYLQSLVQVFASGQRRPAIRFQWGDFKNHLDTVEPSSSNALKTLTDRIGYTRLNHLSISTMDFDRDGREDVEIAHDNSVFYRTAEGFAAAQLRPMPGSVRSECRKTPNSLNLPRSISRFTSYNADPVIVFTRSMTEGQSRLLICNLDGSALFEGVMAGDFGPDPRVKMVDLDRDGRPDFLRVLRGSYVIQMNQSTDKSFAFGPKETYSLDPTLNPASNQPYVITDINGDGLPDLVMMQMSSMLVAYGKGKHVFGPEVRLLRTLDAKRKNFLFAGNDLRPVDANRDGLMDFLAIKGGHYALLMNTGNGFLEHDLSRLQGRINFTRYIYADLMGTGLPQLIQATPQDVKYFSLNVPGTGLITSIDNGLGTHYRFDWTSGPIGPRGVERAIVLNKMDVTATGDVPRSTHFSYQDPKVHSKVPMLLGYAEVERSEQSVTSRYQFLNTDDTQGLLLNKELSDTRRPGIAAIQKHLYSNSEYNGLSFYQLDSFQNGYGVPAGPIQVGKQSTFSDYNENLCPQRLTTTAGQEQREQIITYTSLGNHFPFACMQGSVQTQAPGIEDQFWRYEYTDQGLIKQITRWAQDIPKLVLQDIAYDELLRPTIFKDALQRITRLQYRSGTLQLQGVQDPFGVVRSIGSWDPAYDQPQSMHLQNGQAAFDHTFAWDNQERLHEMRNSLYPSSDALSRWSYRLSQDEIPGLVEESRWIDPNHRTSNAVLWSALGKKLGEASAIDEGFTYDNIQSSDTALGRRFQFAPRALTNPPETIRAEQLLEGARALLKHEIDGLGWLNALETTHEKNVVGAQTQVVTLDGSLLKMQDILAGSLFRTLWLDGSGRIRKIILPGEHTYRFDYDGLGRLNTITLPSGVESRIAYDGFDRKQRIERQGIGSIVYEFSKKNGLAISKTYFDKTGAQERSMKFSHDELGRIQTHTLHKGDSTASYEFHFDGKSTDGMIPNQISFLNEEIGPDYRRKYIYTVDGRLSKKVSRFADSVELTEQFSYEWDGFLNERRITLKPLSGSASQTYTLQYLRDGRGRLKQINGNGQPLVHISHDNLNRIASIVDRSGRNIMLQYDEWTTRKKGWKSESGSKSAEFSFHREERGLIHSQDFSVDASTLTRTFRFDDNSYLEEEHSGTSSLFYAYDDDGLRSMPAVDNMGRRQFQQAFTLHYGIDGQLESAVNPTGLLRFSYDSDQQRIARYRNGHIDSFFAGDLIIKADKIVQKLTVGGQLLGLLINGEFKPIHADHLGTPFRATADQLQIVTSYGHGEEQEFNDWLAYVSQGMDPDLRTLRFGVRDYDPVTGLFATADPLFYENPEKCLESPLECNLYSYALNNPLKYIDPTGTCGLDLGADNCAAEMKKAGFSSTNSQTLREMTPEQTKAIWTVGADIPFRITANLFMVKDVFALAGKDATNLMSYESRMQSRNAKGEISLFKAVDSLPNTTWTQKGEAAFSLFGGKLIGAAGSATLKDADYLKGIGLLTTRAHENLNSAGKFLSDTLAPAAERFNSWKDRWGAASDVYDVFSPSPEEQPIQGN